MDSAAAIRLYYQVRRIRLIEEGIARLYPEQEMRCPVHLSIGQEGVAVGVCAPLTHRDYAFSAHRSHAHYLAKGGDLRRMMGELYGKVTGCCLGKGGSMHLVDTECGFLGATPIVGSTIPIAVGAAFGSWLRNEDRVTVVFFGDGAVEEGVFHEAMNFAALKALPVVFVCENNYYSIYTDLTKRQPNRPIYKLADGYGMEGLGMEGNDTLAVAEQMSRLVNKARSGSGPSLIELRTFRKLEHCGPNNDNHLNYRPESEIRYWEDRDPVDLLRDPLKKEGKLSDVALEEIDREITEEFEAAVAFAKSSPFPEKSLMYEHVYAA